MSDSDNLPTAQQRRGGRREGAGRKPKNESPKVPQTYRLDQGVIDHLNDLAESSQFSRASIVEYAIKKIKKLPKKI